MIQNKETNTKLDKARRSPRFQMPVTKKRHSSRQCYPLTRLKLAPPTCGRKTVGRLQPDPGPNLILGLSREGQSFRPHKRRRVRQAVDETVLRRHADSLGRLINLHFTRETQPSYVMEVSRCFEVCNDQRYLKRCSC